MDVGGLEVDAKAFADHGRTVGLGVAEEVFVQGMEKHRQFLVTELLLKELDGADMVEMSVRQKNSGDLLVVLLNVVDEIVVFGSWIDDKAGSTDLADDVGVAGKGTLSFLVQKCFDHVSLLGDILPQKERREKASESFLLFRFRL